MITRMDFIALTFFLLSPLLILSQKNIFKTYTVEDGLVSNPVKRIYQDKKGFMWIATTEGLSKYDGHKFTNYTTANGLSHNLINDLYESPDGKLYVAENNGSVDILQHDAIVRKAAFKNVIINQFYVTRDHRVIAATDGNGFYELKNGNFVKPLQSFPRSTYNGFSELNDSLLIGGSESEGLVHILNMRYGSYSEIKQPLMTHRIYKDSKNRTWLCTNDGLELVSYFQKNDQPLSIFLLRAPFKMPDLRKADVADIMEDASGNFWIATTHGLVEIHPDGDWQLFSEKDGLPSPDIACIYQDIEKNIWIGTSFGLAKLITKKDIRIYTLENGLTLNHEGFLQPLFNSTKKKFLFINSPQNYS